MLLGVRTSKRYNRKAERVAFSVELHYAQNETAEYWGWDGRNWQADSDSETAMLLVLEITVGGDMILIYTKASHARETRI